MAGQTGLLVIQLEGEGALALRWRRHAGPARWARRIHYGFALGSPNVQIVRCVPISEI